MLVDDLYHTSTWMDPDRTKRLQAILQWSLRQQEEEGERIQGPRGAQIDPERQRWLKEALEAFSSQPSETDLLKAALTVLKTHSSFSAGDSTLSDSQLKNLEEAFEQAKYYVEDMDHANDLIPFKGTETIIHFLSSENVSLTKLACELIAVASQNNPPCQKAFLPALAKLLELVRDVKPTEDVKIQAVRAISSLSRGYEPGLRELLVKGGFSIITDCCLHSGIRKVTIKALFMISSFYTSETDLEVQDLLNAKIGGLLPSLTSLLRDCDDSELLEHILSLLSTLLNNRLAEVKKEHDAIIKLRDALVAKQSSLSSLDFKDELEKFKELIQRLCEVL